MELTCEGSAETYVAHSCGPEAAQGACKGHEVEKKKFIKGEKMREGKPLDGDLYSFQPIQNELCTSFIVFFCVSRVKHPAGVNSRRPSRGLRVPSISTGSRLASLCAACHAETLNKLQAWFQQETGLPWKEK